MKNLLLFVFILFNLSALNLSALDTSCNWNSWFKYPKVNSHHEEGKPLYVRVDPQQHSHIAYMELYANGKYIRKESSYPYEWCKGSGNSDAYLRHLKAGKHHLKVKIVDKCGRTHYKECYIHVKGDLHRPSHCQWDAWFKYPQHNGHYEHGKPVYVRVDAKNHQDIAYMELYADGRLIRKESSYPYEWCKGSGSSDGYLRRLDPGKHHLKVKIVDKCGKVSYKECYIHIKGGHHQPTHCQWDAWFKYPQHNGHYEYGKPVYVRVDAKNHQDIAYMELYADGRLIRKESSYPYEWCKGSGNSDSYLRRLSQGKHHLKVKIVDKCGKTSYKECYIHIDGGHHQPSHCQWDAWFKYPQHNGHYEYGKPVYVRVDAKNHQDIAYMELYADGRLIRKESSYPYEWCKGSGNSDSYLRRLSQGKHHLKVKIVDKCGKTSYKECYIHIDGGHHQPSHCQWDAWFKYPKANSRFQYGKPVYVKVDPKKYQDIAYMELYVDGKFIRKEIKYPFEWCKGSGNGDSYLRHLPKGKHHLKVKIIDKCGDVHYKEVYVFIDRQV